MILNDIRPLLIPDYLYFQFKINLISHQVALVGMVQYAFKFVILYYGDIVRNDLVKAK